MEKELGQGRKEKFFCTQKIFRMYPYCDFAPFWESKFLFFINNYLSRLPLREF